MWVDCWLSHLHNFGIFLPLSIFLHYTNLIKNHFPSYSINITINLYSRLIYWPCPINNNLLTFCVVRNIHSTGSMPIFRTCLFLSLLKVIGYLWWIMNIGSKRFMKKKFTMPITRQHQVYGCVVKFIEYFYQVLRNTLSIQQKIKYFDEKRYELAISVSKNYELISG